MSHDGSWRRSTWTPPKRFKSSVISKQARRWESTGAPFNSRTRAARLPDWHSPRLSRRQLSRLIVFLPLNPEEFTTLGDCETYSALLLKCTYFAHRCARPDKSASRHLIDCWREGRFVGTNDRFCVTGFVTAN